MILRGLLWIYIIGLTIVLSFGPMPPAAVGLAVVANVAAALGLADAVNAARASHHPDPPDNLDQPGEGDVS